MNRATTLHGIVRALIATLGLLALAAPAAFAQAPEAFNKIDPGDGTIGMAVSAVLSWGTSSSATSYEYCVDTTNDNTCGTWINTGTQTTAAVQLLGATPYYWQVRATNAAGTTYANGSSTAFWTFTTSTEPPPGVFSKTAPADTVTGQSTSPILSWGASADAHIYQYCIDTSNDNACSTWMGTLNTSVAVSTPLVGATYYWQVRAVNNGGTTYANGTSMAFWSFTTTAALTEPANHVKSTAATLNASVNPTGISTTAFFEYGQTTSYGSQAAALPAPGSGNSFVPVSAAISGLTCNTTYHFRVVATNVGSTLGPDVTFTTGVCPSSGFYGAAVQALAVDPTNGRIVYAGTSAGIYKSVDGGAIWQRVDVDVVDTNVVAIAIDPNAPCTIYGGVSTAATSNLNTVLIRSNDCGANWEYVSSTPFAYSVPSLAFTNANPSKLYWSQLDHEFICPGEVTPSRIGRLTPFPTDPVADTSLISLHDSARIVATDPMSACTVYAANGSSVQKNESCFGWNWTSVGTNGISDGITALAVHPTNGTLFAGSIGAIYRLADAGSPWQLVATVTGTIVSIVYEPGSPTVAYAAGGGGIVYKTTDGGDTWSPAVTIGSPISSLGVSSAAPTSVYAGGNSFVINIGPAAPDPPPTVWTQEPASVAPTVSTLVAIVNPNGTSTTARFEYGLTTSYGNQVTASPAGSGWSPVMVSAAVTGLNCQTLYHFRAVATNVAGTTNGADMTLITDSCVMTSASIISDRAAPQLAGTSVTFTAGGVGGVGPYAFKFFVTTDNWATWTVIRDWSTTPTATWTPATANAGYQIGVGARSAWNTADAWEAATAVSFPITPPLVLLTMGVQGSGNVRTDDGFITCPSVTCTHTYQGSTTVLLQATPAAGFVFGGWSSSACSSGSVVMSGPVTCGATFLPAGAPHRGSINLSGAGLGDVFTYDPVTGAYTEQLSDGLGHFGEIRGTWPAGLQVYPADFNNDGRTDFLVYSPVSGAWSKAINDGAGGFTYTGGTWPTGLQLYLMDLNGDSQTDLFAYNPTTGLWSRCVSTGNGTVGFACTSGTWPTGVSLYPADFNGDGLVDLFAYNATTGAWSLAVNNGTSFTYSNGVWPTGLTLLPGDFNGDGRSDFFVSNPATGAWSVATTQANLTFTYVSGTWSVGWTFTTGDFNGDGKTDLFLYDPAIGTWYEAISNGLPSSFTLTAGMWSAGWQLQVTDLNGDGQSDVLLYAPASGVWYQALHTGSGLFTYTTGTWSPGLTVVGSVPKIP